jgi:hypothetical protein
MPSIFPPGDTNCRSRRRRWREQTYLFRELVSALIPPLGLQSVIDTWSECRQNLADDPRRRKTVVLLS